MGNSGCLNAQLKWVAINGIFMFLIWATMWKPAVAIMIGIMAIAGVMTIFTKFFREVSIKVRQEIFEKDVAVWIDVLYDVTAFLLLLHVGWTTLAGVYAVSLGADLWLYWFAYTTMGITFNKEETK